MEISRLNACDVPAIDLLAFSARIDRPSPLSAEALVAPRGAVKPIHGNVLWITDIHLGPASLCAGSPAQIWLPVWGAFSLDGMDPERRRSRMA
jgi:hypothetical protein